MIKRARTSDEQLDALERRARMIETWTRLPAPSREEVAEMQAWRDAKRREFEDDLANFYYQKNYADLPFHLRLIVDGEIRDYYS